MSEQAKSLYTIEDLMDRTKQINEICSIVSDLPLGENTCIAINGKWGCGKTHVVNILQGEFEKEDKNIVIKYDAWENNFYDDPLITILYCILDKLKVDATNDKALKKIVKATLKEAKKDWDGTKNNILNRMAKAGKDSTNFKIALACCLIDKIINIGKSAKESMLDNKNFADFKSYQSLLKDAKDFLNGLTSGGKKLILLVDEVDRCLPDEQLVILERLHHLFQINNCVVIVSLNKEAVIEAYMKQYCVEGSDLGNDYLKKFFEHNIELDDKKYVLFNNYLTKFIRDNIVPDEENAKKCVSDIYKLIIALENKAFRKTQNLDARNIVTFRRQLERILGDRIKKENMEYLELWFTIIMLYCKMFNPGYIEINEYREGNTKRKEFINIKRDLFQDLNIAQSFKYNYGIYEYYVYQNGSYNHYQYLLNYCLYRHGDAMDIKRLKEISDFKDDYPWIDNAFALIDRYGI